MSGHEFSVPDDLGWQCNDEISKAIDQWRNNFVKVMKRIGQDRHGNWDMATWEVSKAELMDDIYAIIKKYQSLLSQERIMNGESKSEHIGTEASATRNTES